MSTTKRSRQRQADPAAVTSLPPAKRAKIAKDTQQTASGLAFLADERQRSGRTIRANVTNGDDNARLGKVEDAQAAVLGSAAAEDDDAEEEDHDGIADSDDESEASSTDEAGSSSADIGADEDDVAMTNGNTVNSHTAADGDSEAVQILEDTSMNDLIDTETARPNGLTDSEPEQDENVAPSFGEMLQTLHPEIIDVTAAIDNPDSRSKALIAPEGSKVLQAPSSNSFGTVLSQALRTNDKELLESCLQTKDIATIKSTIQRLQSPLVATLMQKLAERLHKRPGRAGPLMVWVQWSLVAHGGYLAGQPQLVKKLRSLRQVVKERAGSLQSLITLKGKLDLLSAQVELRRSIRSQNAVDADSDEDDEDIVYVEGVDVDSSSEDVELMDSKISSQGKHGRSRTTKADIDAAEIEELDGDVPLINGIDEDAEMESLAEENDDDDGDGGGLIDDEAEESDMEESVSSEDDASDSANEEDAGDDDDDSSSEDEAAVAVQRRATRSTRRTELIRKR